MSRTIKKKDPVTADIMKNCFKGLTIPIVHLKI
jgi:hypothetical protein